MTETLLFASDFPSSNYSIEEETNECFLFTSIIHKELLEKSTPVAHPTRYSPEDSMGN